MDKKYCRGCGVELQNENISLEGYVNDLDNDICQRCFRMNNYGEYQVVTKSNEEFITILKSVNETNDLVLHLVDLVNLDKDLADIKKYMTNKMMLVLNKRDALPKSIKDEKIINYIKGLGLDYIDIVIISANKNYNIDLLISKIMKYKTSTKVYVVGKTNTGKSSLINRLIHDYSENISDLTISPLPSTTLNLVSIVMNKDLVLIDTPGLIDRGNISNYLRPNDIKKLINKKEIKPKTYQIKPGQCLIIDDIVRIDYVEGEKNSFTLYIPNSLKVKRMNANKQKRLKELSEVTLELGYREDIVINGLGWVKLVDKAKVNIYIDKNVEVFTRRNFV
jgi:ribosome biogenesis GTPase YqeH